MNNVTPAEARTSNSVSVIALPSASMRGLVAVTNTLLSAAVLRTTGSLLVRLAIKPSTKYWRHSLQCDASSSFDSQWGQTFILRRTTEGFYDTALNEANDALTRRDSTKAKARCQRAKVCPKGLSVKTMLCDRPPQQMTGFFDVIEVGLTKEWPDIVVARTTERFPLRFKHFGP